MVSIQQWLRWAGGVVSILAVALVIVPDNPRFYAENSSVTIRAVPASEVVIVNGTFTVEIVADLGIEMDPYGLSGYEFSLVYDTDHVEVVNVADAGQLGGPNSRIVGSLGPKIDDVTGRSLFGAYSYQEANPQSVGPKGTVALANVTLIARQVGETSFNLENAVVTDTQGRAWPDPGASRQMVTQSATVLIVEALVDRVYLPFLALD